MKPTQIEVLAHKIQLIIKEEEMPIYLEAFSQLEKLLSNFKKLKVSEKVKTMTRINTGYLNLSDLKKLKEKYTNQRVDEKALKNNAEVTNDRFIFFKGKNK